MKKLMVSLVVGALLAALSGCALFNGEFDAAEFFKNADISIEFVDPVSGETWSVAVDENGVDIIGRWVDSNGITWVAGEGVGAITVITREGLTFSMVPEQDQQE